MILINSSGWVDLQVNGYKGVDFANPKLTLKDIEFVSEKLLEQGISAYCPTLISSCLDTYKHNLPIINEAMNSKKGAEILGVHLEGPFINPNNGPRGVHNKKYVIAPSIVVFQKLSSWANHHITILTLDPSTENALNLIKYIVDNSSTVVSIGHHNANREIIRKAVNAGAKAATHVGNGLSEYIHRFDNPIWPILAEDKLFGLFITDGFHLPEEMIKVCLRAKGIDKFIVTSDLTYLAGFRPGDYIFDDVSVVLEPNGLLHVKNSRQLAGSTRNMSDCMNYLLSLGIINESEAYKIGYNNPLKLINKTVNK